MAMTRRGCVTALAVTMVTGGRPALARAEWEVASPLPDQNCLNRNLRQFLREAQEGMGGFHMRLQPNGSLLKADSIYSGLRSGAAQMGMFLLAAQGVPDPMLELDCVPLLVRNLAEARRLTALTRPAIERCLQQQGLTLLYLSPWPPPGLYSSFSIHSLAQLRGTRMRAMTPMVARLANLAGAMATRMDTEEMVRASAARIATTMLASPVSGVDMEAWRFSRFFTPLDVIFPNNAICAQTRAFEALSTPQRGALREAAAAAERRAWDMAESERPVAQRILQEHGMVIQPASTQLLAELEQAGEMMLEEWRARAGKPGIRLLEALRDV